jgi:hypothetical protein
LSEASRKREVWRSYAAGSDVPPRPTPKVVSSRSAHTRLAVVSEAVHAGAMPTRILRGDDGGLIVLDASCPENGDEFDGELVVVCEHCLLDLCPEVGRGLDVARRAGAARLWQGEWLEEMA